MVTPQPMSADADRARDVLTELLRRMGIDATVDVSETEEQIVADVKGPEAALVIGKKGQTLDALQYLIGKIVHRGVEQPGVPFQGKPIVVDTEGYRARRVEALTALAHRLGDKALRTRRPVAADPMSPGDRRVLHMALAETAGVTTKSEGEGAYRRVVVIPT